MTLELSPASGPRPPLSASQQELLEAILCCRVRDGRRPTLRELMEAWGRKSFSGLTKSLKILARKGYVR